MSKTFTVRIASVPDRENVVAEVWYGDQHVAEVRDEGEGLMLHLYLPPAGAPCWDLPFDDFARALSQARARLSPG